MTAQSPPGDTIATVSTHQDHLEHNIQHAADAFGEPVRWWRHGEQILTEGTFGTGVVETGDEEGSYEISVAAKAADGTPLAISVTSHDPRHRHELAKRLQGRRVRVTITTID